MKRRVRISLCIATGIFGIVCSILLFHSETNAALKYRVARVKVSNAVIRKKPSVKSKRLTKLKKWDQLYIRTKTTKKKRTWYKVSFLNAKGKRFRGYIKGSQCKTATGVINGNLNYKGSTTQNVKLKKVAVTSAPNIKSIKTGKSVKIIGYLTIGKVRWYQCKYKGKTGYLLRSQVYTGKDIPFEEKLKGFPASYKTELRLLHKKYPKWVFKKVDTGLNWSDVQENESKPGLNVIQSNVVKGGEWGAPFSYLSQSKSCYNPSTDTYTVFDGTNWYGAAPSVIAHYMDPRNSLTEEKIWQFKSLKYEGTEKKSVIQNMLKDTFMSGTYTYTEPGKSKKITRSYASSFLQAGKKAGISSYFLAARSRQELGLKGSASVSGTYPGYKGYYNYYNVGANDSREGLAIRNGLRFAKKADSRYIKPWNTPYKAICGGAIYIAQGYLPVGQITNYFHKFNVVNKEQLYRHQYMSNVQAPTSESITMYNTYKGLNILKEKYVFYIPVYRNMPSQGCKLPAVGGNTNNYLRKISFTDASGNEIALDETFAYNVTDYHMVVKGQTNLSQITLNAKASKVSKYATIVSGLEELTIDLSEGKSYIWKIVCCAQNGQRRTYQITIRAENGAG